MSKRPARSSQTNDSQKIKRQKSLMGFLTKAVPVSSKIAAVTNSQRDIISNNPNRVHRNESNYHIFLDLDGVLVDFQAGLNSILSGTFKSQKSMWITIAQHPTFFRDLPWTSDGLELWNTLKYYNPEILTGVARSKASRTQKFEWCSREFQNAEESNMHDAPNQQNQSKEKGRKLVLNHVDMAGLKKSHTLMNNKLRLKRDEGVVNVITCWSTNKHLESGRNRVLIDDREDLRIKWEERGGIFIHHTDTKSTLEKLRSAGIISVSDQNSFEAAPKVPSCNDSHM